MFKVIRQLGRALLHPAPAPPDKSLWRRALLSPRIFDVLSLFVQLRDLRRRRRIDQNYAIDDEHYRKVQDYNSGVTQSQDVTRTRRSEALIRMLSLPPRDLWNEQLLLIGPRDVHELLLCWLYGFRWANIRGIDLYSTNPKISVMNMEAQEFADNSFDAILMANTLAYAKSTQQCLAECVRVLKPGGRLVFGATYFPEGEYPGNHVSGSDILKLLYGLPVDLCGYNPVDKTNALNKRQTVHLFSVVKHDASAVAFDRIDWRAATAS